MRGSPSLWRYARPGIVDAEPSHLHGADLFNVRVQPECRIVVAVYEGGLKNMSDWPRDAATRGALARSMV